MNFKSRNDYAKESTKENIAKGLYKLCQLADLNDKQTIKVLNKWMLNSKYNLNIEKLIQDFSKEKKSLSSSEFYSTLKKLGYDYERYSKLKNKNFYKELNYKRFFHSASNYLNYELEKEQKHLENELRYELEYR